jgi:hypothetical protein
VDTRRMVQRVLDATEKKRRGTELRSAGGCGALTLAGR